MRGFPGSPEYDAMREKRRVAGQTPNSEAPLKVWENYSICPEVSLGPNQKIILCDENTLRQARGSDIFDSLTLIVNCH
jgi:hypothetical protein